MFNNDTKDTDKIHKHLVDRIVFSGSCIRREITLSVRFSRTTIKFSINCCLI